MIKLKFRQKEFNIALMRVVMSYERFRHLAMKSKTQRI